jgi:plasmid stabilization system protein ParE
MTYTVHPSAERDLAEASDFYVSQAGEAVARRFLAEFERVALLLARRPDAGSEIRANRRKFNLAVFPYTVIYRKVDVGIQVLVVRHQSRRPGYGMGRR